MNIQTNFDFPELFNSNVFSSIFQKSTSSEVILWKDPVPEKGIVTEEIFAKALPILIYNSKLRDFLGVLPKFHCLSKKVAMALDDQVWECVQGRLNQWYPVPRGNMGPRDQVSAQIKYLLDEVKFVKSLEDFQNFPEDIQTIAMQWKVITLEEIKYLEDFRKARDTLVVWRELSSLIGRDFSYNDLNTGLDWINKANTFREWVFENSEQLDDIQELSLSNKGLSTLPPEIGNLRELRELDISRNWLKDLSPKISNLRNLRKLVLNSNQLKDLPAEIGDLKNLERLILANNQLRDLPSQIGSLWNLKMLNLMNNQLEDLPTEIGNLLNLIELYLKRNWFEDLPPEICKLGNLQTLDLANNQLKDLPAEIGYLRNLNWLRLSFNQLKDLPAEIVILSNLDELFLPYNQLKDLSPEIIEFLQGIRNLKMHSIIPNGLMFKYLSRDRSTFPSCTIL